MILKEKFKSGMKLNALPLSWFRRVTAWINNFCEGPGIHVSNPSEPGDAAPVKVSIDEAWLNDYVAGKIPDLSQVVKVLPSSSTTTLDGNTASGTDETLDQTTWSAGGVASLAVAKFTRSKAVTVSNVYYYRLFWRIFTYNPNGTIHSVSAEQGYIQVRRL